MSREAHVRFWERVGVRLPCATRHIVTDTCGLLVGAEVHPADVQDRDGAVLVIEAVHQLFPWLRHLFADSVYNGPNLPEALAKFGKWTIEIVKRAADAVGFQLLPRRWVVERTLAWLNRNRRLWLALGKPCNNSNVCASVGPASR